MNSKILGKITDEYLVRCDLFTLSEYQLFNKLMKSLGHCGKITGI